MHACHKVRTHIRVGSFQYFFLLFFLLIMLPMLVMGGVFTAWVHNQNYKSILLESKSFLEQVAQNVESVMQDTKKMSQLLVGSNWVNEITYMQGSTIDDTRVDFKDLSDYTQQMRISAVSIPFVQSMAVAFNSKDYVITSDGIASGEVYIDHLYQSNFNYKMLKTLTRESLPYYKVVDLSVFINDFNGLPVGKTIVYVDFLLGNPKGDTLMVCYLPLKKISRYISGQYPDNQLGLLIQTADRTPLLSFNIPDGLDASNIDYTIEKPFFRYSLHIPDDVLIESTKNTIFYVSIISFMLFIITLLVSYLLSVKQISHLIGLEQLLPIKPQKLNNQRYSFSYNEIGQLIQLMSSNQDKINHQIDGMRPLATKMLLMQLYLGDEKSAKLALEQLKAYEVDLNKPCFMVVMLRTEKSPDMTQIVAELNMLMTRVHILYLSLQDDLKTLLINCEVEENVEMLLQGIDALLVEKLGSEYGMLLAGTSYPGTDGIKKSYEEVLKFREYRLCSNDPVIRILSYSQFKFEYKWCYYSLADESCLINALINGQLDQMNQKIDEVFDANASIKWMSTAQLQHLVASMIHTVCRAIDNFSFDIQMDANHTEVEHIYQMEEARAFIHKLFTCTYWQVRKAKDDCEDVFISEMKQFVDDNYMLMDMSLTMLANHTGKPEYVLSRICKKCFGMGFAEYVQNLRIERAKSLIQSDCNMNELPEKLGFGSNITFRRTFKKLIGVSPTDYKATIADAKDQ